ncbi:hypothetical protein SBV1_2350006 [Verrucomicrobia bacterium]|nr:hypothetical protein SBV1_2350006 [Verrucomicrobiota bacterium]
MGSLDLGLPHPAAPGPEFGHECLVLITVNSVTYPAVLFGADFVARSLQTAAGMVVARAASAPKTPRRLRDRICGSQYFWKNVG